jgi:GntR family transcriptional regulator/MocR family aminotransferase
MWTSPAQDCVGMDSARKRTRSGTGALVLVTLRPDLASPLYRQIYLDVRRAILEGRLQRGSRLPSTRNLALDLRVSRATAVQAYDQLRAEGYVESVSRGATRVSSLLPDPLTRAEASGSTPRAIRRFSGPSARGIAVARASSRFPVLSEHPGAFRTSVPALDVFPVDIWERLATRRLRRSSTVSLAYADPRGLPALRGAIARYLTTARGVRCDPEQVLVTSGSQQALDLAGRVLLDPGDPVWMEDPGYFGAAGAFVAAGARIVPVPVDGEGLDVEEGIRVEPRARLAFVTPARQLPLGITMSVSRRLALLRWADSSRSWVLEDDYDSEFRYTTRPLSSLQGVDSKGCVIFTGTFSKVMFPAMRIGYLVVPGPLVDTFSAVRRLLDFCPPHITQATLAEFMTEGHFERHVRRMRVIYQSRRTLLVRLLQRDLRGLLEVEAPDAGMNLLVWLPPHMNDRAVSRALASQGIDVTPLSRFSLRRHLRPGLILGFSGMREHELRRGVVRLRSVLESLERHAISRKPR